MLETVSIILIVLAAAFLQGLTGFGFGLIALPLLGFFLSIKTSVPLMVLLALIISLYLTIRLRKCINLKCTFTLLAASNCLCCPSTMDQERGQGHAGVLLRLVRSSHHPLPGPFRNDYRRSAASVRP
ncbi:sulfite exporter TauE/SafE family protein [Pseudodesulfovibrio thermohalotolerans]|uniref:sulfite exporter TauE/SafE family protein n=1 Tax=Pseudodesulfovibrio thermohalotolerans TaxID=2880651 RepID=UPI00384FE3A4